MKIIGYDNRGKVKISKNKIVREIYPEFYDSSEEIFALYEENNLNRLNIVETSLDREKKIFIHEKHTISYPYEWSPNMFKDAVLYHLKLYIELNKYNLILKDSLPSNILFKYTEPIFIDFFSIIKKKDLIDEKWLVTNNNFKDHKKNILKKMMEPFLFIPLIQFYDGDFSGARINLSKNACNMVERTPILKDFFEINNSFISKIIKHIFKNQRTDVEEIIFMIKQYNKTIDFYDYLNLVIDFISGKKIKIKNSGYLDYYKEKGEDASYTNNCNWGLKQKHIFEILKKNNPKSMLDFGANTGWFSFLAESLGIEVISIDKEDDCIDYIYKKSKQKKKNILPLVISYKDLNKKFYGKSLNRKEFEDRDFTQIPIYNSPINRLSSEIVLCLGLIHHLVLGEGNKIIDVIENISKLAQKYLVLEFVDLSDDLIKGNPSYFKNLDKFNNETYNLKLLVKFGKMFFSNIEIYDSNPKTRKLLFFSNKVAR